MSNIMFKNHKNIYSVNNIGKLALITTGGTPSTSVFEYWYPKEIPWMASGEIHKKRIKYTDNKISANGYANSSAKMVNKNSVLIALAGQGKTRGTVAINEIDLSTNQSIAAMTFGKDIYPDYVLYNLENRYEEIRKMSSSDGGRGGLNKKMIADILLKYPEKKEQQEIGDFFKKIDLIVDLYSSKVLNMKKTKCFLLQTLYAAKNEKKPRIRFNGFNENWEYTPLFDVLTIKDDKNNGRYSKYDVLSVSDEFGCVNQIKFQGRSYAGEDISKYKVVKKGDLIYTRSPLQSKPFGIIKIVGDTTGIISPLYIVNIPKNDYNSDYIYYLFDSPAKTNNYLAPLVRKGAKNTMNISNTEWLSGDVVISKNSLEQAKIGSLLNNCDKLIKLYNDKLALLSKIKKSLLKNVFE